MPPRKRKNVEESLDNDVKKMRTSSNSLQTINFSRKYLRTRDSNIKFNHPPISNHSDHHSHKLKSFDLVEHVFGSIVSIKVAATILLAFIRLKLVQVHSQNDGIPHPTSTEDQIDACINAAVVLHTNLYHKQPHGVKNLYEWEWSPHLGIGTESGAAMFLNTVAVIAHRVISSVGVSPELTNRPINTLWTTISKPNDPPVHQRECNPTHSSSSNDSDKAKQGCDSLPSIVALPIEAFIVSGGSAGPSNEMRRPSVYSMIDSIFADLSINPVETPPSTTSPANENELEQCENIEDFRTFLRSHVEKLPIGLHDFSHFQQDQLKQEFMCFGGFVGTGWAQETDTQAEPSNGVSQELSFMQRQHLAQPHSHFVLGLVIMANRMTLCRGDSMGTEEYTFNLHTGSGMLEAIRLALGFAIADNETLGHDPAFELEREFSGYNLLSRENDGKVTIGDGIDHKGVAYVPKYYNAPPDNTGKYQRYYLHYLVDNRGSFYGRMTRVWCAYRQVESEEEIASLVHPDDQMEAKAILLTHKEKAIFVGPYALKYQNIDTSSITSKENIVQRIMEAMEEEMKVGNDNEKTGVECILLPQYLYKRANILHARGFTEERGIPRPVAKLSPRQNVVTISLFKRTLSQYEDFDEVVRAITDGYRAINWLHGKGFLHRDISDSNLLLSRENPTEFKKPFSPQSHVVLCRRKISSPSGVHGVLHDFDLSGLVYVPQSQSKINPLKRKGKSSDDQRAENIQIGTSPYMSIRVLKKALAHHTISDDMESLFYILYLFPFSNASPKQTSYPHTLPNTCDIPEWPHEIKQWASFGFTTTSLESCGFQKFGFFTFNAWLLSNPRLTKNKHFKGNWPNGSKNRKLWERLVNMLHNEYLFYDDTDPEYSRDTQWDLRKPGAIAASITNLIKALDQAISQVT